MANVPKQWEKHFIHIILGGAVASIALLPFIISEVSFFPGNFARAIFFRIIVEIMLVAFVGLIFINKKYFPPINLITMLIGAWWGTLAVSTLFSPQPLFAFWGGVERMEGFFTMSHYFLFCFILAGVLREKKQWFLVLNAGILGSVLMSGIGILQHFNIAFTYPVLVGSVLSSPRAPGTLENPLFLSGYLLFFIFLALTFLALNIRKKIALAYGAVLLLQIIALYFTDTRGGQIAFLVGVVWFILLLPSRHRLIIMGKIIVGAASILVLVAFIFLIANNALGDALEKLPFVPRLLFTISDAGIFTSYLDQRLDVIQLSWEGFKMRPILGYGPESFTLVMDRLFPPQLNIYFEMQWLNEPLNIVFDTLLISGILGLATLSGLFLTLFWKLVIKNRRNILFHGLFVVFLVYAIQNQFSFDMVSSYVPLFVLLAFASFLVKDDSRRGWFPVISFPRILSQAPKTHFITLGVVGTVLLGSIFFLNIQPLLANRTLNQTIYIAQNTDQLRDATNYFNSNIERILRNQQILSFDNNLSQVLIALEDITTLSAREYPEQTREILKNAIKIIEKERDLKPQFSKPEFLLAQFYTKLSQFDETAKETAKEHFARATELSPNRYIFWLEWAKADPLLGTPIDAIGHGQKAILLINNPGVANNTAHFWIGIGFIYNGEIDKAQPYVQKLTIPSALQYLENTYKITQNYDFLITTFYPERIKEDPKNLQLRASLAITYYDQGDTRSACRVVRDLLQEPDLDAVSRQGGESFLDQLGC